MRYHTLNFAVIGTAVLGLGQAFAVPTTDTSSKSLLARDEEMLTIDINPDLTNPQCGTVKKVQIDWKSSQAGGEKGECIKLKKYISDERGDWFGGVDVDLVATTCSGGTYTDPWAEGKKERPRVVFTPDAGESADLRWSGTQKVAGKLVFDSPTAGRIANPQIFMGITTDAKQKSQKYQYIYCYN